MLNPYFYLYWSQLRTFYSSVHPNEDRAEEQVHPHQICCLKVMIYSSDLWFKCGGSMKNPACTAIKTLTKQSAEFTTFLLTYCRHINQHNVSAAAELSAQKKISRAEDMSTRSGMKTHDCVIVTGRTGRFSWERFHRSETKMCSQADVYMKINDIRVTSSTMESVSRAANQSTNQSINQSVKLSASQSVSRSFLCR